MRHPTIGQGELLTLLMAAWWYALNTGRRLVIDWRGMWWARERQGRNVFPHYFKNRNEILGVPIHICETGHQHEYRDAIPVRYGRDDAIAAVCDQIDCKYDAVVFNHGQSMMGVPPAVADRRRFMQSLEPCDDLIEEVARYDHHFTGPPVVGIHFRHGNGEDIGVGRRDLWPRDTDTVADDYLRAVESLGFGDFKTLVCTDYLPAREAFLKVLPNAFHYDKWLPPVGRGSVHNCSKSLGADVPNIGVQSLAEYMVLARCNAMVYTDSLMTIYTRYVANFEYMKRMYQSGGCPFDLDATVKRMRTLRAEIYDHAQVA